MGWDTTHWTETDTAELGDSEHLGQIAQAVPPRFRFAGRESNRVMNDEDARPGREAFEERPQAVALS